MTDQQTLPKATTEAVGIEKQFDLDPRPWNVHVSKLELSVCDASGKEMLSADPDDRYFWTEVASRVNAHDDLVKALEPFAAYADAVSEIPDADLHLPDTAILSRCGGQGVAITYGDLRAARAAVSRSKAKGG